MSTGNSPDAIAAFRSVLDLAPEDADAHYGLGLVMAESGDLATAVKWFDKTLALKPGHGRAKASLVATLVKQGDLAVRAGDRRAAEPPYARATQLQPASAETAKPYCDNLVELGRHKEAWDAANNARKLAPNDHALRELFELLDTDPRVIRAKRENSLI
jgi:Flp pilus assembly protein TadD